MYNIYKRIVLGEDPDTRSLDASIVRSLGVGQHSVRVRHVEIIDKILRLWFINQFDEVHTEPVTIYDGDDRISWNLWRLLLALMQDRSETFRARSLIVRDPNILEQITGISLTIHLTHGEGYSVVRGANDRYWPIVLPSKDRLGSATFDTHGEALMAAEQQGYPPSKLVVAKWETGSSADIKPLRFEVSDE